MFFTWFIFLCNDVHVSNNFDWNVSFDNIISGKWINIVNLFHLNTWNVGEVLNTINAQVKPWFTLSLQKSYMTLTIEKKSVLVGNCIFTASQLHSSLVRGNVYPCKANMVAVQGVIHPLYWRHCNASIINWEGAQLSREPKPWLDKIILFNWKPYFPPYMNSNVYSKLQISQTKNKMRTTLI